MSGRSVRPEHLFNRRRQTDPPRLATHASQWFPESRPARYFFLVCVLEAVVDIALEVTIIARTDLFDGLFSSVTRMPLAVYLGAFFVSVSDFRELQALTTSLGSGIFILAHVFQLCLAWDALTVKNTIQVRPPGLFPRIR